MNRIITAAMLATCLAIVASGVYWLKYEDWVVLPRARALISDKLRDPSSTQFRNDNLSDKDWLCGEINTKNGAGGYSGFSRFISHGRPSTFSIEGVGYLDEMTTEQLLAALTKKTEIYARYNRLRKDIPDLKMPSDAHIERMVLKEVFDDEWKEHCSS